MDLNEALVDKCCELLDVKTEIGRTERYIGTKPLQNPYEGGVEYYQVFSYKHGFLPDLSIIDLIFNMGPESVLYLQDIYKQLF